MAASDKHKVSPGQHSDQHRTTPSVPVQRTLPAQQVAPSLENKKEAARLQELEAVRKQALASIAQVGKV